MRDPIHRLIDLVCPAKIKLVDDMGDQQVAQVAIREGAPDGVAEVIDKVVRVSEYGLWSNPPVGAECVVAYLGGRRSMGIIIATGDRATRPKGLEPGEALFGNPGQLNTILATKDGKFVSEATDWTHQGDEHWTGDFHLTGTVFADHVKPADGWTGTFATGDARTVHVTNGIITNVA